MISIRYKEVIFFLVVFTLPMYTLLNNILLGLLIAIFILDKGFIVKHFSLKNIFVFIPVLSFFALAVIATINTTETPSLLHIEKYWSLLLIPLVAISQENYYQEYKDTFFKGLIYGCLATLLICYLNAILEIIVNKEPLSYFLRWRHLGHEFTAIADTHPAYLGLFIVVSSCYILFNQGLQKNYKAVLLVIFALGMMQLTSRTALVIYALVWVIWLFRKAHNTKYKILVFVLSGIFTLTFFGFGSNYLKNRLFNSDSIQKDYRFERLSVSYELFMEYPIIGVGFENIRQKRREKYIDSGYIVAAHNNYNAHNQLFEYLALNGLLGGLTYVLIFTFFIYKTFKERNWLFLFLFVSFFLANITESMMIRIKGIEYFTLFACLYLSKNSLKES